MWWQKIKNFYHLGMAIVANVWLRFPSGKLTVIGVTGTDGKTTTTSLIYHILHTAGFNASMISSVGAIIGGENYDIGFHVTTPSPFSLQRFLNRAVMQGKTSRPNYLVLETTSHALDQYRVFGIKFDVGVLTNVTHEHLDYHKTYKNYVKTKAKLFKMSKISITNRDDESYEIIKDEGLIIKNKIKLVTYGMGKDADINPYNFPFKTNLVGEFNKYNILASVAACKALGLKNEDIRRGIESFVPPKGRGEIVYPSIDSGQAPSTSSLRHGSGQAGQADFTVMIDFAHTPNAIEQILKSVRPMVKGRIIHVFGSAGLRDRTKRPIMGKNSSRYADIIILTAEDPRAESVEKINHEIELGIKNYESRIKNGTLVKINDRKKAIKVAINMAKNGDLVLLTGKSHEKSMNYGRGEMPWDEYATVYKILNIKYQK